MGLGTRLRKAGLMRPKASTNKAMPNEDVIDPLKISFKFDGPGFAWPPIDPPPLPHMSRSVAQSSLPSLFSDSGSDSHSALSKDTQPTTIESARHAQALLVFPELGPSSRPTRAQAPQLGSIRGFNLLKPTMYNVLYDSLTHHAKHNAEPAACDRAQSPEDVEYGVASEFCFQDLSPKRPILVEPKLIEAPIEQVTQDNVTHRLRYPSIGRSEPPKLSTGGTERREGLRPNFNFIDNVPSLLSGDSTPVKTSLGSLRKLPPHRVDYAQYVSRVPRSMLRDSHRYPAMPPNHGMRASYIPGPSLTSNRLSAI